MTFLLLDVVTLVEDISEEGLQAGKVGAVVEVFDKPPQAYLVEFCDSMGTTVKLLPLSSEQLQPANGAKIY